MFTKEGTILKSAELKHTFIFLKFNCNFSDCVELRPTKDFFFFGGGESSLSLILFRIACSGDNKKHTGFQCLLLLFLSLFQAMDPLIACPGGWTHLLALPLEPHCSGIKHH